MFREPLFLIELSREGPNVWRGQQSIYLAVVHQLLQKLLVFEPSCMLLLIQALGWVHALHVQEKLDAKMQKLSSKHILAIKAYFDNICNAAVEHELYACHAKA